MMTQGPTVLIIDDSATSCYLMEALLKKEGYTVRIAGDGREGLTMLARECPHCVVLDVVLPGMSGYEICRLLRSKSVLQGLPIIMVSTKNTSLDKTWALRQGATDYMVKPFKEDEFLSMVKSSIADYKPPSIASLQAGLQKPQSASSTRPPEPHRSARQTTREHVTPERPQAHSKVPPYPSGLTGAIHAVTREQAVQRERLSLYQLIPFRNQGQDMMWEHSPHYLFPGDIQVRRLYEAIDGTRDVETLCVVTQLGRDDAVRALRSLLSQHRVRLREPSGKIVSNQHIGADYRVDS